MADEQQGTVEQTGESRPAPSAGTQNTEPQPGEHMIPKSRFDEVNKRLRELEKAAADGAKAQAEAEQKRLAEQNEYKTLWEKAQADAAKAADEAKAARLEALRLKVIAAVPGFPAKWADRLRGESQEEMEADARDLMGALPKPTAPNTNGAQGDGGAPREGQLSEADRRELAARYGVNPNYWPA